MKFGFRKPSFKKKLAARTSWKRVLRHSMGFKMPKRMGFLTNPKKALYNKVYRKMTFGFNDIFKAGVTILPTSPEEKLNRALAKSDELKQNNQKQEAITVLLPFKNQNNYEVSHRLAWLYTQLAEYMNAEEYGRFCYGIKPLDLENLYVYSITLFNLKKYKESQAALSVLPDVAKTKAIFANIIGANYNALGQCDISVEIYKKCLDHKHNLDNDEIGVAINLTKILIVQKKKVEAKKTLLKVLAVSPMHKEASELLLKCEN